MGVRSNRLVPLRWSARGGRERKSREAGFRPKAVTDDCGHAKRRAVASAVWSQAIIRAVKRLAYILLLVLLPFQFAWAAAAPLCAHETDPNAKFHFGHHSSGSVTDPSKKTTDMPDQDRGDGCSLCHLGSSQVATMESIVAVADFRHAPSRTASTLFESHIPIGPDGPDWHPAV